MLMQPNSRLMRIPQMLMKTKAGAMDIGTKAMRLN